MQSNKNSYNLVCETLQFLDTICGSTTGGLGLLGLYINETNVSLINQALQTLTEYCQGPCHDNQVSKQDVIEEEFLEVGAGENSSELTAIWRKPGICRPFE